MYLVVEKENTDYFYNVNDLNEFIKEVYECELIDNNFETIKLWFLNNYTVYESESEIKMLNLEDL